jgi:hypothetical protein
LKAKKPVAAFLSGKKKRGSLVKYIGQRQGDQGAEGKLFSE